ncbi:transmembrane protein 115 [Diorhabda sublineata]|uniref:transmembrane protein 115 n=1 Tax=Diorhabda sublineata TaxID=1163346 RepID=UPI0024E17757|nr:transmembrane protein 115 [Diorhabda sublineata]XP_056636307.1 transmembrane protein 115 [Diorhabda sublineata]
MAMFRALGRNIPYLKQQFSALLGNTSTSVKFICGVVLFSYGLSFSEEAIRVISVTPGYLMPPSFWLWTAFTFCFMEIHFWEVLVDIVTVGLCGKLIEPLWGQMEIMTFFAIVNFGVAVITTAFYFILYCCTFNTEFLFSVHIHGLAGYIAGVCVTVKQIMPDLVIIKTPLGKLSNRNIPLTVFFLSIVVKLIGVVDGTYPTMFFSGMIVSWVYLRFYQKHSNGTRGDMADYFTFASFFPNVIQPPIAVLSNVIHTGLVKIGICRKVIRKFDMSNPTGVTVTVPLADQHDMERRRQIALKALSERLSKSYSDKQPFIPPKQSPKTILPLHTPSTSKQGQQSMNVTPQAQSSTSPSTNNSQISDQ